MSRITNEAVVDLTQYSAKALSKIKLIENTALILIPENAPSEFYEAFANIKKINIASTIKLPADAVIMQINGTSVITAQEIPENAVVIANGITVLKGFDGYTGNCGFIINGIAAKSKNCAAKLYACNGISMMMPDDDFECSMWTNKVTVDEKMLRHLSNNTLIICSNKIFIDESVSEELIEEKNIRFLCSNKIIVPKKIIGCVKARATVGNKITEAEEYVEYPTLRDEVLADVQAQTEKKHRRFFGRNQ